MYDGGTVKDSRGIGCGEACYREISKPSKCRPLGFDGYLWKPACDPRLRRRSPGLGEIDCKSLEINQFAVSKRSLMRRAKNDAWCFACFQCILPTRGTKTPTVARLQTGEGKCRHRRGEVIATLFREREKIRCHHGADRMTAHVFWACIAAPVPIEPCHGLEGTNFQRLAKHIAGRSRSLFAFAAVVSEHDLMPARLSVEVYDIERGT
jgi:hypothetical protein